MSLQSHRALELPELLSTVFGLLDRQSNAANARVCKVWCDVALDALWMHVNDLLRLFAILAPLEGNFRKGYAFERSLRPADWKRFDKYANRVRWLRYYGFSEKLNQSAFDEIARTRRQLEVFPNLQTLEWSASMSLPNFFMHNGIQKLVLNVGQYPHLILFEEIIDRMPNLSNLYISSSFPVDTVEEDLVNMLHQLPNLRKIKFPRFYSTARILEVLSRLQLLCAIEFEDGADTGDSEDTESFKPPITKGAFPALHDLSVSANFDDITSFLQSPFAPSTLTYIRVDSALFEMPHSVQRLTSTISKRFQELKRLRFESARDYTIEIYTDTGGDEYSITLQMLKPLFELPHLTSFEIYHQHPLLLTQQDIEGLASSCPLIENLQLCTNPAYCMKSTLSLAALIPWPSTANNSNRSASS